MIDQLNKLIRQLLVSQVHRTPKLQDAQVRFQAPDKDWRGYVGQLQDICINIYLLELRENRKLRSNERSRSLQGGVITDQQAPRRVDCHYLISAWSPQLDSLEPKLEEHAMLYEITRILMDSEPLVPRAIYNGTLPLGFPPDLADEELPITVLPVEGFSKYAEFWGTMGPGSPWRPAVYVCITIPIVAPSTEPGPVVTTTLTDVRKEGEPVTAEVRVQIGGRVLDGTGGPNVPQVPMADVWVVLEKLTGERLQLMKTDADGRFIFTRLAPGSYRFRAEAPGFAPLQVVKDVPSPTGSYDLLF